MTKLTDMQLVLLSTAASREDGSLFPPADSIGARADRIRRAVDALLKSALVCEFVVTEKPRSWREADGTLYGVKISDDGRAYIDGSGSPAPASPGGVVAPRAGSKIAEVITLLQRDGGASLTEITALTNWLPHTARAALTGLRKKGHAVERTSVDGATHYAIKAAA